MFRLTSSVRYHASGCSAVKCTLVLGPGLDHPGSVDERVERAVCRTRSGDNVERLLAVREIRDA